MNPTVAAALVVSLGSIVVAIIAAFSAKKAAQFTRATKESIDTVIHMVDGTQTAILAANTRLVEELKTLTKEWAGLAGELRGRDFTREHMEARADKLAGGAADEGKRHRIDS